MGALIGVFDWCSTSLGPIEEWPQSLKSAVGMILLSPVPIVMLWGEDGIMIYNDAYCGFAGARHPELLGSKVREGWPEVAAFNDNVMKVVLAGGTLSYRDQQLTLRRSGAPEEVWMNLDYSPVPDESGKPAGVIAIVAETTERMVNERKVRESEVRFRRIADSTPTPMWVTRPDRRREFVNRAYVDFLEISYEEAVDFDWRGIIHPEDHDRIVAESVAGEASLERFVLEGRYRRANGEWCWLRSTSQPRYGPDGEPNGFIGVAHDVTAMKQAEEALRESETRLQSLSAEQAAILSQLAEGVIVADAKGAITFVNEAAARLHGVARLDVTPERYSDTYHLFTEDGRPYPPAELPLARVVADGKPLNDQRWRIRTPDGRDVLALGSARPVVSADSKRIGTVLTLRDETDRRATEEALRESEERFREIFANAGVGMLLIDKD